MAQRRMFSLKIVDTDAFLDMPQSSQLLYFHLAMRADDEGFVSNPRKIMRIIGSQDDDLKVLIVKKFLIPFESGICVVKHWLIHNLIRMDRFEPTTYAKEKAMLGLKENKAYTIKNQEIQGEIKDVIPNGNHSATQVKLSKVKLSKVKEEATTSVAGIPEIFKIFEQVNPAIKRMYGNTTQRLAADRLISQFGLENVKKGAEAAVLCLGQPFAPRITTPYLLELKWADLKAFYQSEQNKKLLKGKRIISSTND